MLAALVDRVTAQAVTAQALAVRGDGAGVGCGVCSRAGLRPVLCGRRLVGVLLPGVVVGLLLVVGLVAVAVVVAGVVVGGAAGGRSRVGGLGAGGFGVGWGVAVGLVVGAAVVACVLSVGSGRGVTGARGPVPVLVPMRVGWVLLSAGALLRGCVGAVWFVVRVPRVVSGRRVASWPS